MPSLAQSALKCALLAQSVLPGALPFSFPSWNTEFDLEVGERSWSPHGTDRKGLVTRIMDANYQCSIINTSEDMSQVQFLRQTDGQINFNVPRFGEIQGTITYDLRYSIPQVSYANNFS